MYKWSGRVVKCKNLTIRLTNILSERYVENLGECVIVADGKPEDGRSLERVDSSVVVKLRVQYSLTILIM